jgi:phospholipid/cholesterol/gamma-HCH transport system permease protein
MPHKAELPELISEIHEEGLRLSARGAWTAMQVSRLEALVDAAPLKTARSNAVRIDLAGLTGFDTFGAWVLERLVRASRALGQDAMFTGIPDRCRGLIDEMAHVNERRLSKPDRRDSLLASVESLGRTMAGIRHEITSFLEMLGAIAASVFRVVLRPKQFRLTSTVHQLDRVSWHAVAIVVLITFLIGCIIAQQGFFHFRKFGADDYVVDLVSILVVREIGVLIVAIMVAGRSGSSYTAELGSMKMREEIDALRTMGLNPVDILILPRALALVFALPALTLIGNLSALFGGGLVAWFYGGMSPAIYTARLNEALSITHFHVGILKAPFMALVIGVVACAEGLRVRGSAESLGLHTTTSVVKSIFLVIVLDGLFAVFFASVGM